MNFVFKMAWRDSRASRRRLLLFSLSIVFGIATLVALGSFSGSLGRSIHAQARGLLGADLMVTGRAAPGPELERRLAALGGAQAREVSFSSMMVFPTAAGATRMVQVRALEGGFPFYGDFVTEPAAAADRLRQAPVLGAAAEGVPVVLEDTLLAQFNLQPGDQVRLGRTTFTVAGALKKLPGDGPASALLAPRALIPLAALPGTGLGGAGALLRHQVALKLPPGSPVEAAAAGLRERFRDEHLSVETAESRERQFGRALSNSYAFLSLVGFIALLLGAIGVASAIHVYVRQKIATIAVLRCLGASVRQGFAIYLLQGAALGAVGAVIGAAGGVALQLALPWVLKSWLPFPVDFRISLHAVARGMAAGWGICFLFALLPLLAVRRVSPLAALRAASAPEPARKRDPWFGAIAAVIVAAVAYFAIGQTHSVRIGLGFTGMLLLAFGALAGLARLAAAAARRWAPRRLPYEVRQGVANLHRPNNRTRLLLLSLGLGTFLILTLVLARATLLREIEDAGGADRPNLLFFDVPPDQMAALGSLAAAQGSPVVEQAAVVTMKIAALNGRRVADLLADPAARFPAWTLRHEYRSTYRDRTTATEKIVAGQFTGRVAPDTAVVPISIEEGLADDMHLRLGDEIEWDVQGASVRSRVASVRTVEWRRLEPNFFVVFPAGVLEGAPQFGVAAVRAATPGDSARLQRAAAAAFPAVTAIDLTVVRQTLDGIFSKVSFAIGFMAFFTVATGLVVLAGAVAAGRDQRARETVLLRTLGATGRQLGRIQLAEHAILGILAAVVGAALALAANALLARWVFRSAAAAPPLDLLAAVGIVTALTLATGRIADRGLLARTPLEALRREAG